MLRLTRYTAAAPLMGMSMMTATSKSETTTARFKFTILSRKPPWRRWQRHDSGDGETGGTFPIRFTRAFPCPANAGPLYIINRNTTNSALCLQLCTHGPLISRALR